MTFGEWTRTQKQKGTLKTPSEPSIVKTPTVPFTEDSLKASADTSKPLNFGEWTRRKKKEGKLRLNPSNIGTDLSKPQYFSAWTVSGIETKGYDEIVKELTTGEDWLKMGEKELKQLRSAYDTDPSQSVAETYNTRLKQMQDGLNTYNSLIDRYNYLISPEGIKARKEEVEALMEQAERAKRDAKAAMTGAVTQVEQEKWRRRLESATEEFDKYSYEYNDLLGLYYETENQEKIKSLQMNGLATGQYISAKELGEDLDRVSSLMAYAVDPSGDARKAERDKKYLLEKYGVDEKAIQEFALYGGSRSYPPRTDGGYNNLSELYQELQGRLDTAVEELENAGYDYGRMERYAQMQKDAKSYEKRSEEWKRFADEHPGLSSTATVLLAPFQGLDYVRVALGGKGTSDDKDMEHYEPMNVCNMHATNFVNEVRGTVAKNIEENTDWEIFGQNVASFLYQTGMSVVDDIAQVEAFGPAATLFMGTSAASNQAKNVIERGGTNKQAFWGGLAAGAADIVFDKLDIDRFFKTPKTSTVKNLLQKTVKRVGTGAGEEMLTEISNILTDAAIMGSRSEYDQAVAKYMEEDLSREEAKKRAFLDCVGQVMWAGVGGVIAGTVSGITSQNGEQKSIATEGTTKTNTSLLGQRTASDLNWDQHVPIKNTQQSEGRSEFRVINSGHGLPAEQSLQRRRFLLSAPLALTAEQKNKVSLAIFTGASEQQVGSILKSFGPEVVQAVINEGLQHSPNSDSGSRARRLQEKVGTGQEPTGSELARLYDANEQAAKTVPTQPIQNSVLQSTVTENTTLGESVGLTTEQRGALEKLYQTGHTIKQLGMALQKMGPEATRAVIAEGLRTTPGSDSYNRARTLQRKLNTGESITASELGHLYQSLRSKPR